MAPTARAAGSQRVRASRPEAGRRREARPRPRADRAAPESARSRASARPRRRTPPPSAPGGRDVRRRPPRARSPSPRPRAGRTEAARVDRARARAAPPARTAPPDPPPAAAPPRAPPASAPPPRDPRPRPPPSGPARSTGHAAPPRARRVPPCGEKEPAAPTSPPPGGRRVGSRPAGARGRARRGMRKLMLVLLSTAVAAMALGPPAAARPHERGKVDFTSLSADPGRVTGGDVLLAVDVPRKISIERLRIERNGGDVTAAFDPDPARPGRLVGLVDGLSLGRNTIQAFESRRSKKHPKRVGELRLRNFPITGPVFSGPHQTPFICQTGETDLGPPIDADCSAPRRTDFFYRSTETGGFKPLPDPTSRPADLAQTTTRSGETVDYVVRVESGTINRAIYRWAVLAVGGEAGNGWNHRLVYEYGGGCGTGYHQGTLGQGVVL